MASCLSGHRESKIPAFLESRDRDSDIRQIEQTCLKD